MEREEVDLCFLGRISSKQGMPPLPCSPTAAPGPPMDKVLSKSLSPCKISNNSILEEINVVLFHELLSQPATSRAGCHFWGLIMVDILWYSWYSFAFATTPQPISQPFTHHLSKWQYYSLQLHHLPPLHMASLTLINSTRAQTQGHSSSGTAILLQLHPSLAEEPEIQEFLLYFQAYMCLKTGLLPSEGQAWWVVQAAVSQIHLRQGTNPLLFSVCGNGWCLQHSHWLPRPIQWRPELQVPFSLWGFEPLCPFSWEDNRRHLSGYQHSNPRSRAAQIRLIHKEHRNHTIQGMM